MADPTKCVPENAAGDFFVDSTCIDCDTCRQLAPKIFGEAAESAFVRRQPQTAAERRATWHAVVSCPTGSIGCLGTSSAKEVMGDFPLVLEEPVYYCGFNSPKSFGGNSYFSFGTPKGTGSSTRRNICRNWCDSSTPQGASPTFF